MLMVKSLQADAFNWHRSKSNGANQNDLSIALGLNQIPNCLTRMGGSPTAAQFLLYLYLASFRLYSVHYEIHEKNQCVNKRCQSLDHHHYKRTNNLFRNIPSSLELADLCSILQKKTFIVVNVKILRHLMWRTHIQSHFSAGFCAQKHLKY